ncbi:hypothetical protein OG698_03450 [Streptomyces sp. NBC_01003]|uniref:hypothetical protein n=1 Tax=Streptomyces sp. NBC_01003 TaxID=2903714 RepID=UPI00386FC307|nr:hypothetical protein OG698_03450 [Streptomyces sp. NBC_01003]
MRMTPRALRTTIVAATATAAISLVAASGAMAATQHTPTATAAVESAAHAKKKRVYLKSVKLAAKGHTAKVYKTGKRTAQADVLYRGKKVATLTAAGKAKAFNLNGLHVKLSPSGAITSWVDRAKPQPKPKPVNKRVLVATATLADGSGAKVYKLSADHYQVTIFADGSQIGTLDANGRSAAGESNGLHVVLAPDGRLSSWIDEAPAPAPDPQYTRDLTPTPDSAPPPDLRPEPGNSQKPDVRDVPDVPNVPDLPDSGSHQDGDGAPGLAPAEQPSALTPTA